MSKRNGPYVYQYLFKIKVQTQHMQGGKEWWTYYVVSTSSKEREASRQITSKVNRWFKGTPYTPLQIEVVNIAGSSSGRYEYVLP